MGTPPRAWGGHQCADHLPANCREHPHVRGEDRRRLRDQRREPGTPPCVWGGRRRPNGRGSGRGNTPTCVGRTWKTRLARSARREHPHVRGEDNSHMSNPLPEPGTPHARGEDTTPDVAAWEASGTPPRAWGGLCRFGDPPVGFGNTPHVRGEDRTDAKKYRSPLGTPPRAWGGPLAARSGVVRVGNTPTCVGRTTRPRHPRREAREHPHVRGEDQRCTGQPWTPAGTPPRAWGGRRITATIALTMGNTPTCVGRTWSPTSRRSPRWEHPHVRGEDLPVATHCVHVRETPPRAWGGHTVHDPRVEGVGNTPTCVGRTDPGRTSGHLPRKHPHVRGEDAC